MHYLSERSVRNRFVYSRHTEFTSYSDSPVFQQLVTKLSNQNVD